MILYNTTLVHTFLYSAIHLRGSIWYDGFNIDSPVTDSRVDPALRGDRQSLGQSKGAQYIRLYFIGLGRGRGQSE